MIRTTLFIIIMDDCKWDIRSIFTYDERMQEHTGDEAIYKHCKFLTDFGGFSKGDYCKYICIECGETGSFTMNVDCDGMGCGGIEFVPVWTRI